jgi:hypothetical protein
MAKWSKSGSVVVLALTSAVAWGQGTPPAGMPTVLAEPIPYNATQAAAAPSAAPVGTAGACSEMSLPANIGTAWNDQCDYDYGTWYGNLGYKGLFRERPGHRLAAVLDPSDVKNGQPPPANAPEILDFHDIPHAYSNGVVTTIGYHFGCCNAIELTGFYMSQVTAGKQVDAAGRLSTPFHNFPVGFEGDDDLFLHEDVLKETLKTAIGSAELNYRWWYVSDSDFSYTLGIRYFDLYERFDFYNGDDDLTVHGSNGLPDPRRQATYSTTAHNRLLMPQLGYDWTHPVNTWLALQVTAKGAWGVNFLDVDTALKRGDGFQGPPGHRSDTLFSHLYEMGFYVNIPFAERGQLRAGYNLMWAVDVAEATSQVDYNLANHAGKSNNEGSIFYHGPTIELKILF